MNLYNMNNIPIINICNNYLSLACDFIYILQMT